MRTLIVFNRNPYDGTDITWNGPRLAQKLLDAGVRVKIFFMNDPVDMAREACRPPEGYFDLGDMLTNLIAGGVQVKICGTCRARCGIHKGRPYFEGTREANMAELARWVIESEKIISFLNFA